VINGQALCPTCNRRKGISRAVSTAPITGHVRAAREIAAAVAAAVREQHKPTRSHGPAGADHDETPECHQEIR
jgi:hypothetical protein